MTDGQQIRNLLAGKNIDSLTDADIGRLTDAINDLIGSNIDDIEGMDRRSKIKAIQKSVMAMKRFEDRPAPVPPKELFIDEGFTPQTKAKTIKVEFEIDWNKDIGKVDDQFTLAMSPDTTGLYTIGDDIEKFCGIPEADVVRDVKAGKEKPDDAIVYGMTNVMNGGSDIYFWTNGTRLSGASQKVGIWPAVMEQVSHECTHLTRLILARAIAKKKGVDINTGEWVTFDYGAGEYNWPAIGDPEERNPIVMIDEEAFATAVGLVVQTIVPHFLEMASAYLPKLKK